MGESRITDGKWAQQQMGSVKVLGRRWALGLINDRWFVQVGGWMGLFGNYDSDGRAWY